MDRYGGSADVRAVPGEGTEVRLRLPDPVPEATEDRDHPEVPDQAPPREQTGVGAGAPAAATPEEAT